MWSPFGDCNWWIEFPILEFLPPKNPIFLGSGCLFVSSDYSWLGMNPQGSSSTKFPVMNQTNGCPCSSFVHWQFCVIFSRSPRRQFIIESTVSRIRIDSQLLLLLMLLIASNLWSFGLTFCSYVSIYFCKMTKLCVVQFQNKTMKFIYAMSSTFSKCLILFCSVSIHSIRLGSVRFHPKYPIRMISISSCPIPLKMTIIPYIMTLFSFLSVYATIFICQWMHIALIFYQMKPSDRIRCAVHTPIMANFLHIMNS